MVRGCSRNEGKNKAGYVDVLPAGERGLCGAHDLRHETGTVHIWQKAQLPLCDCDAMTTQSDVY